MLQEPGAVSEASIKSVVELIGSKQDRSGRWPLEAVPGKMWPAFGEPGQANKWVTIQALRVLRAFSEVG
ncbi:MAG: hypothetical protein ACE5F6_07245 [Anaerolineae bacterium]